MFIIAQILGLFGIFFNILAIRNKKKVKILSLFVFANIFFAISYYLLEAYSGALICIIFALQSFISYMFASRKKKFPLYLIPFYLLLTLGAATISYQSYIDLIPIICSLIYTTMTMQHQEKTIRYMVLAEVILWVMYDIFVGAYTAIISDTFLSVMTFLAIIKHNYLAKEKWYEKFIKFFR